MAKDPDLDNPVESINVESDDQEDSMDEAEDQDQSMDDEEEDSMDDIQESDDQEEAEDPESMDEETTPDHAQSNEGWADIMQKILNSKKPKRKKTIVLAKAKKLSSVKAKEVISAPPEPTEIKMRKTDWLGKGRIKPDPLDRNRERTLQKIAVRGVVQLFNAVNQLQKNIGKSETTTFKEDKKLKSINKNDFLDILLKGNVSGKSGEKEVKNEEEDELQHKEESDEEEESNTWSALKDNFMTNKKLKNWDKSKEDEIIEI